MSWTQPRPNFFVLGAPKTGTTAICRYLAEHPRVFFSEPKELFHWCSDFPGQQAVHGMQDRDAYLARFSDADPEVHLRIGEGSTHYLVSETAVRDIVDFDPDAKLIAVLRDPMDLAPAYHGELVFNFQEDLEDFAEAWALRERREADGRVPTPCPSPHNLRYHDFGLFAPQLRRLFAAAPPENRLVLLFDDFAADPARVWSKLLDFLDLPDDGRAHFPKLYAARSHRFEGLARLYKAPPPGLRGASAAVRRVYHRLVSADRREAVRGRMQVSRKRDPLSAELREDMARVFAADIAETAELLGRDLSAWGDPSP